MKAIVFFNVLWIISVQAVAQSVNLKGKIVNNNTNEPVIYAAVGLINANIGVSSDELGQFELKEVPINDTLIISSIGFKMIKIPISHFTRTIKLTPSVLELPMVTVKPKKVTSFILNEFKKRDVSFYHVCHAPKGGITQIAQFFKTEKEGQWFLKEIKLVQLTMFLFIPKEPNIFRLRFYGVNELGKPNDVDIFEPILVKNDGSRIVTVDLSDKNWIMPTQGLFIALEWIKTENNMYGEEVTYNYPDKKKEKKMSYHYAPTIGLQKGNVSDYTYFIKGNKGSWSDENQPINAIKRQNQYHTLGMSLKVSD